VAPLRFLCRLDEFFRSRRASAAALAELHFKSVNLLVRLYLKLLELVNPLDELVSRDPDKLWKLIRPMGHERLNASISVGLLYRRAVTWCRSRRHQSTATRLATSP
jgi:hypothetical protein